MSWLLQNHHFTGFVSSNGIITQDIFILNERRLVESFFQKLFKNNFFCLFGQICANLISPFYLVYLFFSLDLVIMTLLNIFVIKGL